MSSQIGGSVNDSQIAKSSARGQKKFLTKGSGSKYDPMKAIKEANKSTKMRIKQIEINATELEQKATPNSTKNNISYHTKDSSFSTENQWRLGYNKNFSNSEIIMTHK